MMIQGITVDCWDTLLVQSDHTIDEKRRRLVFDFFVHNGFSDEQTARAIDEERKRFRKNFNEEQRTPGLEERLEILAEILYGEKMPEVVGRLAGEIVTLLKESPPLVVPGVPETLHVLASRHRLGLISNISLTPGHLVKAWLSNRKLLQFFHTLTFSNDHVVAKPHPAIFRTTLERMGVAPSEAVHVGNDEVLDVQGPHAAGMKAILFTGVIPGPPQSEADVQLDEFHMIPEAISRLDQRPADRFES
ncbi:MAG: HAD family hydrolase [Deltaproteobacteria bacterium]|nr:HAD family hydrolase [Deltaproteobacteria bacterium]